MSWTKTIESAATAYCEMPVYFCHVVVVVSSSYQSPSLGVSRFRSAQSITILLSVWSTLPRCVVVVSSPHQPTRCGV